MEKSKSFKGSKGLDLNAGKGKTSVGQDKSSKRPSTDKTNANKAQKPSRRGGI